MAKNLVWGQNLGPQHFFSCILPLHVSHCCKLSLYAMEGKIRNQTWENGKKPSFETDFGHLGPNLGPKIFFFKDFTSTKC